MSSKCRLNTHHRYTTILLLRNKTRSRPQKRSSCAIAATDARRRLNKCDKGRLETRRSRHRRRLRASSADARRVACRLLVRVDAESLEASSAARARQWITRTRAECRRPTSPRRGSSLERLNKRRSTDRPAGQSSWRANAARWTRCDSEGDEWRREREATTTTAVEAVAAMAGRRRPLWRPLPSPPAASSWLSRRSIEEKAPSFVARDAAALSAIHRATRRQRPTDGARAHRRRRRRRRRPSWRATERASD